MINDLLNYLFSSEVDKELDAIKNEQKMIDEQAVPKFRHWDSRIKQFEKQLNEYINRPQITRKFSETERQIILSRFSNMRELSDLAMDYVIKTGNYSDQIYKAKSLEEKRECLSVLLQYAQDGDNQDRFTH